MTTLSLNFLRERITKNTYRFAEVDNSGVFKSGDELIGKLYIQKAAFPDGEPSAIQVTVEVTA